MDGNARRYLQSIAAAATEQSRQVRDLIGGRHWLSDGKHKEALLSSLLARHSPSGVLVTSGFVVHPGDLSLCSREQDILVLDTTREAPLFHQGGLSIALPNTVLGAVSVKTSFAPAEFRDSCASLNSVLDVANRAAMPLPVWLGAFFFEEPSRPLDERFVRELIGGTIARAPLPVKNVAGGIQPQARGLSAVASAKSFFARVAYEAHDRASLTGYNASGLAAALFLAHFIDHVATRLGAAEAGVISFADAVPAELLGQPQSLALRGAGKRFRRKS